MGTGLNLDGGTLQRISANATLPQMAGYLNDVIARLNKELETKSFGDGQNTVFEMGSLPDGSTGVLIRDKSGVPLALFGQFPDGSVSLKVAKPGQDVTAASDNNLIFNSNQNVFKIIKTMDVSVVVPGSSAGHSSIATATFPHGLGFSPAYVAYNTIPSDMYADLGLYGGVNISNPSVIYAPLSVTAGGTSAVILGTLAFVQVSVDATNVSISAGAYSTTTPYTFTSKVYLQQETAT